MEPDYAQPEDLPSYTCHKKVKGCKIGAIQYVKGYGVIVPEDNNIDPFKVSKEYLNKHEPSIGGYFVLYEDGYQSFSPEKAFEDGYTLVYP